MKSSMESFLMPWHLIIRIGRAVPKTFWFLKHCPVNDKYSGAAPILAEPAPFF
jgi:hypothetical protein